MGNDTAKKNQGVIYGKEGMKLQLSLSASRSPWFAAVAGYYTTGRESYLKTIGEIVQLHSTFNVGPHHRMLT